MLQLMSCTSHDILEMKITTKKKRLDAHRELTFTSENTEVEFLWIYVCSAVTHAGHDASRNTMKRLLQLTSLCCCSASEERGSFHLSLDPALRHFHINIHVSHLRSEINITDLLSHVSITGQMTGSDWRYSFSALLEKNNRLHTVWFSRRSQINALADHCRE